MALLADDAKVFLSVTVVIRSGGRVYSHGKLFSTSPRITIREFFVAMLLLKLEITIANDKKRPLYGVC